MPKLDLQQSWLKFLTISPQNNSIFSHFFLLIPRSLSLSVKSCLAQPFSMINMLCCISLLPILCLLAYSSLMSYVLSVKFRLQQWMRVATDLTFLLRQVSSLAEQLKKRGTFETLGFFLTGEAKLEQVSIFCLIDRSIFFSVVACH